MNHISALNSTPGVDMPLNKEIKLKLSFLLCESYKFVSSTTNKYPLIAFMYI